MSDSEDDFPLIRRVPNRQVPNRIPVTPEEEPIVVSSKDGKKFAHGGHLFWFSKNGKNIKIWVCDHRKSDNCPARIHSNANGIVIKELHEHNHETNGARKQVHKINQLIRERAKATAEAPSQIISTVSSNQPDYVKAL
ncbi:FLYWCH zinc finger domain-containing protein [Ditylenchus destructor]|nr:FLYWCH zinc finger domain-containing protein [Ditylenchus destructor]